MRSIPSLDVKGASVLEDYYQINKDYPNYSLCRTTHKRGQPFPTDGKMLLTPKSQDELMKLFYTHRRELYDKRFDEFVGEEFFKSNFWQYWLSVFAIGPWHGALEMKLYMQRFPSTSVAYASRRHQVTRLNQYDSLILPLVKWLEQGVTIVYDTKVTNVVFDITPERKVARRIEWIQGGKRGGRNVTANDFVLITNGSAVENSASGGPPHAAQVEQGHPGGQHLGDVAQHRRPGPRLRSARQFRSMRAVRMPAPARATESGVPPWPEPMTTASYCCGFVIAAYMCANDARITSGADSSSS